MKQKFLVCKHCGNIVAVIRDKGVPVYCCGEKMQELVMSKLPPVKNKPALFGEQIIMDKHDNVVDFLEQFLITACSMDVFELTHSVRSFGGVVIPAHIDKSSYSILSNLGSFPEGLDFTTVEVKANPTPHNIVEMGVENKYNVLHNSDAHYLWDISEKDNYIECESASISDILHKLSECKCV